MWWFKKTLTSVWTHTVKTSKYWLCLPVRSVYTKMKKTHFVHIIKSKLMLVFMLVNLMLCDDLKRNILKLIGRIHCLWIEVQSLFSSSFILTHFNWDSSCTGDQLHRAAQDLPLGLQTLCPHWSLKSGAGEASRAPSAASWAKNRSFHALIPAVYWSCDREIRCHRV